MKKFTPEELKQIVKNHSHWLRKDCDGWMNMQADLSWADLSGADLSEANLSGADLSQADLSGADLSWADLSGAKNIPFVPLACPDTGAFVGWKKVNDYIVQLQVPEDANRCSATTSKCRCDKALVLEIQNADGTPANEDTVVNNRYTKTIYTAGEMVYSDSWDENRWNECSHGIHFFINRQEAVNGQMG